MKLQFLSVDKKLTKIGKNIKKRRSLIPITERG